MNSPRYLRPHSVTFHHNMGENESWERVTDDISVEFCTVTYKKGYTVSKTNTVVADTIVITVDMSDCPETVKEIETDDTVTFEKDKLKIVSINKIYLPFKNVIAFMEFSCERM